MAPIEQKESMRWLDNLRRSTELSGAPERCVHIGDRESDIYELYCLAQELGTNFLVRSCVDRLAEDGKTTIAKVMADVRCLMLLCLSRSGFCAVRHTKFAIDFADDIAFQAPSDLALAFALSGAFDHIVFCGFMIPHSGDGDYIRLNSH